MFRAEAFSPRFTKGRQADMKITYRLYFLDGSDHIVNAEIFKCMDDDEARALAKRYLNGLAAELWQGGRIIARYERNSNRYTTGLFPK